MSISLLMENPNLLEYAKFAKNRSKGVIQNPTLVIAKTSVIWLKLN
jgi:hypothetical protein